MKELAGRTAVVTGAGSGIGRALACRFATEGMQVGLLDIDGDAARATAELIADVAPATRTFTVAVDVSDDDAVARAADAVFAEFGAVHVLCLNAGVFLGGLLWERPKVDLDFAFGVNIDGVINGIRRFVPRMIAGGKDGVVINTSSTNGGLRSLPNTPIYAATKAAVTSISEVLYQQLLKDGGRVKAAVLFPGPHTVNTSIMASRLVRPAEYAGAEPEEPVAYRTMQDLVKTTGLNLQLTEPEEVASAIRWFLSPEQGWVTGQVLAVDGGLGSVQSRTTPAY